MFVYLITLLTFINLSPSTLYKLEIEEVFQKADQIISANVINIDCVLEETKINNSSFVPFSYITLKIDKVHYINESDTIYENDELTIRQIGCSSSNTTEIMLEIDGLARFELNTKVFLSLNRVKDPKFDDYFYVTANEQGKLDYDSNDTLIEPIVTASYVRKGKNGKINFMAQNIKEYKLENIISKISKIKGVHN